MATDDDIKLDGPDYERSAILLEAVELTCGPRNDTYGSPYTNMRQTAEFWSTYLGVTIQPHQVAGCMALVKLARTIQTFDHRDSYVDGAAYLAIAAECTQGEPK